MVFHPLRLTLPIALLGWLLPACGGSEGEPVEDDGSLRDWPCEAEGDAPDYLETIGCREDFDALASEPLDASIPGARSLKVVLDREDGDTLYFQNSTEYKVHYDFVSEHLSGMGLPIVPRLSDFNRTEYYDVGRRFILGAVTYYAEPDVWALEIAPYDTATPEMVESLYSAIEAQAFFGPKLTFHPTSDTVEANTRELPDDVEVVTTDALFEDISYQPLNLGETVGRLRFLSAAELTTEYVSFRDIVVLDRVPNDITVVSGLITQELQTPLSHVNVLSQNRGTPNMALRDATENEELRALEDEWVRLRVGAFDYTVEKATSEEAEEYWEENRPEAVQVPRLDREVTELRDIEDLTVESDDVPLAETIREAIPAYGGKSSHFSILAKTEGVPTPDAFAIPVHYYLQFMEQNGFDERVEELLQDPEFTDDAEVRAAELEALRLDMAIAPVDEDFQDMLRTKLAEYPEDRMRFRSSTNAEDLDGFTGAGLYQSRTGVQRDWDDVLDALRDVWAGIWLFRAFEERSYRSIDHTAVGMAILVHHSFPDEEMNGVALTANPYDSSGLEKGFYVNVQPGESSVVEPQPGITTEQFIYYYNSPNDPIVYLSRSNLVLEDERVLSLDQVYALGDALEAVHQRFSAAYGPAAGNQGWYAMEVEFKFDGEPGEDPPLVLKQARPHPGRGQ